jgi:2-oxo-4-hydroxy-4-carboxy-5-ureidoimidazoline decarboxylase
MPTLTLSELNACGTAQFVAALGNIFEHSPWIAERVAQRRPFAKPADLLSAMISVLDAASASERLALIKAHPDLADKAQRAAGLTAESEGEQAGAGLDRLTDAEYDAFTRVNAAYRAKFDFPCIICVRRHTKDAILREFARRLQNDKDAEAGAAVSEICRIAALRLDRLIAGEDRLPVHGRLSTHVLDTHAGRPAQGVSLELVELSELGYNRVVARATTNADGRTDVPLIHGRPLPVGRYRLTFDVGPYFARLGVAMSDPPFLDKIPIRFSLAEPEGHYHVPLLMTPWSYSTYRGS